MRHIPTIFAAALAAALLAAPAHAGDQAPLRRKAPAARARPGQQAPWARRGAAGRLFEARAFAPEGARARGRGRRASALGRLGRMERMGRMAGARQHRGQALQRMQGLFERLDRNGDGVLDRREFAFAMALHMRAQRGAGAQGRQAPAAHGPRAQARQGARLHAGKARGERPAAPDAEARKRRAKAQAAAILHRLQQADADKDGKLSREEAPPVLKQHFARLDRNEDGLLDKAEIKGALELLAQARPRAKAGQDTRRPGKGKGQAKGKGPARKPGKKPAD